MWRLLLEDEEEARYPLSALCFSLAAITRPEGMMYGVVALVTKVIFSCTKGRFLSIVPWICVLLLPFCSYLYWRYEYFCVGVAQYILCKIGQRQSVPTIFLGPPRAGSTLTNILGLTIKLTSDGSFKELIGHGLGYMLPLLGIAMAGLRSWRFALIMLWMLPLLFVPWDCSLKEDTWIGSLLDLSLQDRKAYAKLLMQIKVFSLLATAIMLGLCTLGQKGWKARSMLWAMGCSSIFFVLYSGGDWMDQFRWFHIVELFFFPIFVEGVYLLFTKWKVQHWFIHSIWAVPATLFVVVEVTNSVDFAMGPETSVNDIHRRVRYMSWVQQRLDVDDITLLDVDMGAHMYYSGWDIVDIAGLIDVSMAQHSDFNFSFIRQYIFEERNPDFAHVHGGWAKTSRIPKHKEWKKRYLEIPGYPVGGRTLHIGNHVRKDLFIQEYDLAKKPAKISFGEGLSLVDYTLSAKEVAAGDLLYFYTAWNRKKRKPMCKAFSFLSIQMESWPLYPPFSPVFAGIIERNGIQKSSSKDVFVFPSLRISHKAYILCGWLSSLTIMPPHMGRYEQIMYFFLKKWIWEYKYPLCPKKRQIVMPKKTGSRVFDWRAKETVKRHGHDSKKLHVIVFEANVGERAKKHPFARRLHNVGFKEQLHKRKKRRSTRFRWRESGIVTPKG